MKSKKIIALAIVSALVISAASSAISVSAATIDNVKDTVENDGFSVVDYDDSVSVEKEITVHFSYTDPDDATKNIDKSIQCLAGATVKVDDNDEAIDTSTFSFGFSTLDELAPEPTKENGLNEDGKEVEYTFEWNYPTNLNYDAIKNGETIEINGGTWTETVVEENTTTPTDPIVDEDEDNEQETRVIYAQYTFTDGYYFVLMDDIIVEPEHEGDVTVVAPAAPKGADGNEFVEWHYQFGAGYEGTCQAGEEITLVDASEVADLESERTVTFEAVWSDPEGSVVIDDVAYAQLFVPSTKDDKNAYDATGNGTYIKYYKSIEGKLKGTFNLKDEKFTPDKDSSITLPKDLTAPKKDGYTFVGWNTSLDGKGTTYKPGDTIPVNEIYDMYTPLLAVYEQSNPGTGDDFMAAPFIAAAVVSLGAVAGVMVYRKKRELAEEAE